MKVLPLPARPPSWNKYARCATLPIKRKWLYKTCKTIKTDKNIPLTMEELTKVAGTLAEKSANVIMRAKAGKSPRCYSRPACGGVAPCIGIANGTDPKNRTANYGSPAWKKKTGARPAWPFRFGREICRSPANHNAPACVMNKHCAYLRRWSNSIRISTWAVRDVVKPPQSLNFKVS